MSRVREYKTSAQIAAERQQRARLAQRVQQETERAYREHTPRQVQFCADMIEAGKLHDDLPYWRLGILKSVGALV